MILHGNQYSSDSARAAARPAGVCAGTGPALRSVLFVIFAGFALLGATGGYMLAVRLQRTCKRSSRC